MVWKRRLNSIFYPKSIFNSSECNTAEHIRLDVDYGYSQMILGQNRQQRKLRIMRCWLLLAI